MNDEVPWLSDDEEQLWRRWLRLNALLPAELHRDLIAEAGLSLPDFDVLVQLTGSGTGKVRVTDLAQALSWERSRVSHHVTRMERRGLVQREECADDRRGAFVVITASGRTAIERAAPGHVRTVRRLVFDTLNAHEVKTLRRVVDKMLVRLEAEPSHPGAAQQPG